MESAVPRRLRGAGIWIVDDHILMESTKGHDRWGLVGGGVDGGESVSQACEREFLEEIAVAVRCERLAVVTDLFITPAGAELQQDLCFAFIVSPVVPIDRTASRLPKVVSQEPEIEFRWVPLDGLSTLELLPRSLDVLVRLALARSGPVYATYDCRVDGDERTGTRIWP
jgi:8-oxo-dGTP pyrophosphatase MutT (NUDIX family)